MVITTLAMISLCIHQLKETLKGVMAGTVAIGTFITLLGITTEYISTMSEVNKGENEKLEELLKELTEMKDDDPEKWDETKRQEYLRRLERLDEIYA